MFCCLKCNVVAVFTCGNYFRCRYCYCCHCIVIVTLIQNYGYVTDGAGILIMRIHSKEVKIENIIRLGWRLFILVTILKVIVHSSCHCSNRQGWLVRLLTASFPNL